VADLSLERARARVEDLPDNDGKALDCVAGAVVRVFARLDTIEAAYRDVRARLRALEDRPAAGTAVPVTAAEQQRVAADHRAADMAAVAARLGSVPHHKNARGRPRSNGK
jgi:hypothetical protein